MHFFRTPLLFLLAIVCASAHAQGLKTSLPADTGVLDIAQPIVPYDAPSKIDEKVFGNPYLQPEYIGGTKAMYRFIESNLKIPIEAKKAGISGRVFVTFIIEETGEITNVSVLKGLGFGCDAEAVRVVQMMPRWKPGRVHGKPYKVKYNLPISFVTN